MKIKKIVLIMIYTFLFTEGFAGTRDNAEIIGYSRDGKFAALQISGTEDGRGFYYISVRFLNVFTNRFTGPKITGRQKDDEPFQTVQNIVYEEAGKYFDKYKIDKSIKPVHLKLNGTKLQKNFIINNKKHEIIITEIETGIQCNSMSGLFQGKGFSISLNNMILDKTDSPVNVFYNILLTTPSITRTIL